MHGICQPLVTHDVCRHTRKSFTSHHALTPAFRQTLLFPLLTPLQPFRGLPFLHSPFSKSSVLLIHPPTTFHVRRHCAYQSEREIVSLHLNPTRAQDARLGMAFNGQQITARAVDRYTLFQSEPPLLTACITRRSSSDSSPFAPDTRDGRYHRAPVALLQQRRAGRRERDSAVC